jgi:beta-hydroxylase
MSKYFFNVSDFHWASVLESKVEVILGELKHNFHNKFWMNEHPDYVSGEDYNAWQTLTLLFWGIKNEKLIESFPETSKIISEVPGLITAQFSLLKGMTNIKPHKGYSSMVLRSHLPLVVPAGAEKCALMIETEIQHWHKGKLLIFDDSYLHSAWNNSNENRIVLMFDFVKPGVEYSVKEICEYKLVNHVDEYLNRIAPKEVWLQWLKQGSFPPELEPPDIH